MTRFFNRKGNRKNSNRPSLNKRRLHLESLEDRMLLAVDSFGAADAMFFGPQQTGQVIEVANTTIFALTKALQGANDGDTLVFAKAGTIKLTTPITINAAVTIDGGAGVTIDGQGNCRLFEFNANATIANMTLTGGSADEGGVACVSTDAPRRYLTFNNCQVYNNHATGGGGAFQTNNGTITLNNCEVYSNTADHGGAAYVAWGATLVINDSVLYGNSAGFGGAIYNLYSKIYTANCTIAGNTSTEGAIMNFRLESDEYPMIEVPNRCF